ncbi:thermostable hemolysin [Ruegeria arenilitoris]|uniref:thermostable hemolysin n=1 Tax=Ruegeria arenilitoris TaxID=1173585 RepID=UPI00147BD532|nr:thermostable hemolysin [Ruegeria arenilitoris]
MKIAFLSPGSPGRAAAEAHIAKVYEHAYEAQLNDFAPLLATATNAKGQILCAAGLRFAQDEFFSECYLAGDFPTALSQRTGLHIAEDQIMEVTSLASVSPFPVLPLLDRMIGWGRDRGAICGVFTATAPLRKLLTRTGLGYVALSPARPERVANAQSWGSYYETDPWVCAFVEYETDRAHLTPNHPAGFREGAA